ncbi:MAG: hypothetical protein ACJAW3_001156 [Lentimonas sp.]
MVSFLRKIKKTVKYFSQKSRLISMTFLWLFLFGGVFYFSTNTPSANINIDCTASSPLNTTFPPNNCKPVSCSSFSLADAKNPDNNSGYNCYYAPLGEPLPPCKSITSFTTAAADPRNNCADLINMPLCSDLPSGVGAVSGVNCVTIASGGLHNKDSIRFCGEACDSNVSDCSNCVFRKCHQMSASDTPISSGVGKNCDISKCNMLSHLELATPDNRFENSDKKYCDGEGLKCYDFFDNNSAANLQYVKHSPNNSMCKIHDCTPDFAACGSGEVSIIENKGSDYKDAYEQYINGNMPITGGLCNRVACEPVAIRSFLCTKANQSEVTATVMDSVNCDTCIGCEAGESCPAANGCVVGTKIQTCNSGLCHKIIDCNLVANDNEIECFDAVAPADEDSTTPDIYDAWFYRPTPPDYLLNKSTDPEIGGRIDSTVDSGAITSIMQSISPDLCYDIDNGTNELRDLGYGWSDPLGLVWWHLLGGANVGVSSPGVCNVGSNGTRGLGYISVCGVDTYGFAFNPITAIIQYALSVANGIPSDEAAYIKGPARVAYSQYRDPEYKITACTRYRSSGEFSVCGARECRIDVADGILSPPSVTPWCGHDVCMEMTVSKIDKDKCSMSNDGIFDGSNGGVYRTDADGKSVSCISGEIDQFVRMRARKYGRKLCVFIDRKGSPGIEGVNYSGQEQLDDLTCVENGDPTCDDAEKVNGVCPADGLCNGLNTNKESASLIFWRTVKRIKYIGNVMPQNNDGVDGAYLRGYYSIDGVFYREQDCALIPLLIGPPRFYQVATVGNSRHLFEPPVYILNSRVKRNGAIAMAAVDERLGSTDFFEPEIEVGYGAVNGKLSLGAGYLGQDIPPEAIPAGTSPNDIILTPNPDQAESYSASFFVKKEYDRVISWPILNLYRNVSTESLNDVIVISSVKRNKPEISDLFGGKKRMRIAINPDVVHKYNDAKLKLRMIYNFGVNGLNDNCALSSDDVCSNEISFENQNIGSISCSTDIEKHEICSKRDECSQLVYECAENEIALHGAINNSQATAQFESVKAVCNGPVLENCNRKMGISSSQSESLFDQINISLIPSLNPNYQSIESILDLSKVTISNPNAYGWFNEICLISGFEDKLKNIEAWKGIDGVLGKCDIDPIKSSYTSVQCAAGGKAPFCVCLESISGIPSSNLKVVRKETPREAGLCIDIPIPKVCLAIDYTEVNSAADDNDYAISSIINSVDLGIFNSPHSGSDAYNDSSRIHTSHATRSASSIRKHAEFTSVLEGTNIVYGQCRAFWSNRLDANGGQLRPSLKCNDNGDWEDTGVVDSCIRYSCPAITTLGIVEGAFEGNSYENNYAANETGDDRGLSNGFAIWSEKLKTNDFLQMSTTNACITGYALPNGGSPERYCKQDGTWQIGTAANPLVNQCERIKCEARIYGQNMPNNRSNVTNVNIWDQYGGAEFPEGKASRSQTFTPSESKFEGNCRETLGYFEGQNPPSLDCDHNGNWTNLTNACERIGCYKIEEPDGKNSNHGFANWDDYEIPSNVAETRPAESCSDGYFVNPYTSTPTRQCEPIFIDNIWQTRWASVSNPCISQCPGGNFDPVNGVTTEKTSGGDQNISWNSTNPGEYAYDTNCPTATSTSFSQGRSNGCYKLRRRCGTGDDGDYPRGQWGPVEPMCSAENGIVGNAIFNADPNSINGVGDYMVVKDSPSGATAPKTNATSCIANFWKFNKNQGATPKRQCNYLDYNTKYVDQVFLNLVDGTQDCERHCPISTGQVLGHYGTYNGAATQIGVGDSISLTGGSFSNSSTGCNSGVTATCKNDGAFGSYNSIVRNCSNCTNGSVSRDNFNIINSSWIPTGETYKAWNRWHNCARQTFKHTDYPSTVSVNHGNFQDICRYSSRASCLNYINGAVCGCIYTRSAYSTIRYSCNDGVLTLSEVASGEGLCAPNFVPANWETAPGTGFRVP